MDKFRLTECQTLDIPVGNDVPLLVKLVKGFDGCDGEGAVPFPIDVCENVVVAMVSERGQVKSVAHRLGTDGEVLLELQAGDFRAGLTYGIDVRATLNGKAVHAYGKSLVRITAATERGPETVAQAADPYEVTLQVGYVGDVIPRRLDELEGYDDLMDEVDGKADAAAVDKALEAVGREFQKYIPVVQKAVAGGVASLNGEKKVPTDQLQFPLRGQLTPSQIDSTSLADGVYQVNGEVISSDILGGAQANGVLVQYPWDSRVQTLFVGRAAAHADGEQVEIYTRRYLPTPKRWTAWMRIDGGGGGVAELMIPVAWAELVGMRNRAELVPGMQYRITDYVATTTQAETQSANRPFDIIVTADSATTLSEWARATHHDGCDGADDPFWNSRLNQWLLRYSLDNDQGRYGWADTQNGKGVVYWMRDEWGNEMPFDFKGILFYHVNIPHVLHVADFYYYYYYALSKQHDEMLLPGSAEINDASLDGTARRNVVKPYFVEGVQMLNRVIFGMFDKACSTNYEFGEIKENIIEDGCHNFICSDKLVFDPSGEGGQSNVKHIRVNRETMPERHTYTEGVIYVAFSERTYGYPEDENTTYTLKKNGTKIVLTGSDGSSSEVEDADTKLKEMTQTEANTGTATTSRTITANVLKAAILKHTSDLVNGGAYNSTSKKIELKHGSTVVAEIDAAPFIVDGMVDDVRIENGNLIIDFNTESGKQDIAIPLTDIFDPSNYYTKTQTDVLLSGKASTAEVTALQQQVAGKQDTIQDLAEIRSGAAAGATALQPAALQPYATQAWVGQQGFLTQHQDISGKEDKMQVVAVYNTEDPSQPVTGVFCGLSKYYRIPVPIETVTLMLPPNPSDDYVQNIVVYLTGGTAPAVTIQSSDANPAPIFYHDGYAIESGKTYELNILWNGAAWVVASVEIVVN